MASNFKISFKRTHCNIYLNLTGDFDGSSAFELINTLEEHNGDGKKTFINTSGLFYIHPFGLSVFRKKFNNSKLWRNLMITGEHATEMELF